MQHTHTHTHTQGNRLATSNGKLGGHTATHCNTLQHTATHCNTNTGKQTGYEQWRGRGTHCNMLQHPETHCNTLQRTHTQGSRLATSIGELGKHTTTRCNTLKHTATHCNAHAHREADWLRAMESWGDAVFLLTYFLFVISSTSIAIAFTGKIYCNTLQHTAKHCNTRHHTATHGNTLRHTTTHCNTLQHATARCDTR